MNKKYSHRLLSYQCREDIASTVLGFLTLCRNQITDTGTAVIPGRVNSDLIGMFCLHLS